MPCGCAIDAANLGLVRGALDLDVGICIRPQLQDGQVARGRAAGSGERPELLGKVTELMKRGRVITRASAAAHERVHDHAGFAE